MSERGSLVISGAMRAVFDAVSDGVAVFDAERKVVYLNRKAQELLGWSEREAVGHRCREMLDTSECDHNCPLTRLLAGGERASGVEMAYDGRGGRAVPAEASFEVIRDERGSVVGSVEVFRDLREIRELKDEIHGRRGLGRIVGQSGPMRLVYDAIEIAARSASSAVVVGEPGTGKELVARAIHETGPKADGPFVAFNCAVVPQRSQTRELFGRRAECGRGGRYGAAREGTLFLDEVDRLGADVQRRLREALDGDVRLVGATTRDLEAVVERGAFDRELFYHLNAVQIDVPPLRERATDVVLLVNHFVRQLNRREGARWVESVAPDALDVLAAHPFPGNVRQLELVVEHAYSRCRGKQIRLHHLPESITDATRPAAPPTGQESDGEIESIERDFMLRVLDENEWRLNAVAEQLGLSRTTLWRKLKRLGIDKPGR